MPKPIFFFKEDTEHGYLCQWYPAPFTTADGVTFNCAEQWMMWSKARMAGDDSSQLAILKTKEPRKQKSLGRKVKGFDDAKWDESECDSSLGTVRASDVMRTQSRARSWKRGII